MSEIGSGVASQVGGVAQSNSPISLNRLSNDVFSLIEEGVFSKDDIRLYMFDEYLSHSANKAGMVVEKLIECYDRNEDTDYQDLLVELFGDRTSSMLNGDVGFRNSLTKGLSLALSVLLTHSLSEICDVYDMSFEDLYDYIKRNHIEVYAFSEFQTPETLVGVLPVTSIDSVSEGYYNVIAGLVWGIVDGTLDLDADFGVENFEGSEDAVESMQEQEDEPYDDLEDDIEINALVKYVMTIYDNLFSVGYDVIPPAGVLTENGYLYIRGNKVAIRKAESFSVLYRTITGTVQKKIIAQPVEEGTPISEVQNIKFTGEYNYFPAFHLPHLMGVMEGLSQGCSWEEVSRLLRHILKANIVELYRKGIPLETLKDCLTNCIIISEFDMDSALRLRYYLGSETRATSFVKAYENASDRLFQNNGRVFHCGMSDRVVEAIIIFDVDRYNAKPLFAYEAVRSLVARGRKPDINNVILGQDVSGRILTENINRQEACVILIGAAARSGKGVLTLNLLGAMLASSCPVIYVDSKPDMSKMLYDLGLKTGTRPATWDMNGDLSGAPNLGLGAPQYVKENAPTMLGVITYLKMLQLMLISAHLEANPNSGFDYAKTVARPYFIFDEALATQQTLAGEWGKILEMAKDKKNEKFSPEEVEWARAVSDWLKSLNADLNSSLVSQLPMSGISTVWLFQTVQPTSWDQYKTETVDGSKFTLLKSPIVSRTVIKLLGKGTGDSEYGLASIRDKGVIPKQVLGNGRHFVVTTAQKITSPEMVTVFKPYLVLNESGRDTEFVKNLEKNIANPAVFNSLLDENGELPKEVGFEGFATMIGQDAIQNLNLGREYLGRVLSHIGLNPDPDAFLYDYSIESFKGLGSFLRGVGSTSNQEDVEDFSYDNTAGFNVNNVTREGYPNSEGYATSENGYPEIGDDVDVQDGVQFEGVTFKTSSPYNETSFDGEQGSYELDEPQGVNPSSIGNTGNNHTDNVSRSFEPRRSQQEGIPNRPTSAPVREREVPQGGSTGFQSMFNPEPQFSVNDSHNFGEVYDSPLKIDKSLFANSERSTFSAVQAVAKVSRLLVDEIRKVFGDLTYVHSLHFTSNGIVANDILIKPRVSEDVIESLPFALRKNVKNGSLVDLFNFADLKSFPYLTTLNIESARLAESRLRRELNLKGDWEGIFKRLKRLERLYIAGVEINRNGDTEAYESTRKGIALQNALADKFNYPLDKLGSATARLWNTTPVKIATGALGWTLGVKAITVAATLFGGWGLLFGALAGYKAIQSARNKRNNE